MVESDSQPERDGVFTVVHCDSAKQFLDRIHLSNPLWSSSSPFFDDEWHRYWIFRGQSDSSWPLLPSVWRPPDDDSAANRLIRQMIQHISANRLRNFIEMLGQHKDELETQFPEAGEEVVQRVATATLQALNEKFICMRFCDQCDRYGHFVPGGIDGIYEQFAELDDSIKEGRFVEFKSPRWTEAWSKPNFAFAQHHGIPTRLLDWTWKPQFAAFFAAEDAVKCKTSDGRIAVYGLNTVFENFQNRRFRTISVPKGENDYLAAQDGVFLVDMLGDDCFVRTGQYPDMKLSLWDDVGLSAYSNVRPLKFTLPTRLAGEVLRLLFVTEGISRASMMPTIDNVAESIKLELLLVMKPPK